jgi:ADP-ribosylation factor-binding protein GGA
MCEEESDDAEAVAKLLEINDSIHRTIERYKLMKAGDIDGANRITKGTLGVTTGVGKNAANELSLIDFDPDTPSDLTPAASGTNGSLLDDGGPVQSNAPQKPRTVEDDLLGLSLGGDSSNGLGAISLGPSTGFTAPSGSIFSSSTSAFTPAGSAYTPPSSTISSFAPSQPVIQQSQHTSPKPNYDPFASLGGGLPSSKPATPVPAFPAAQAQSQPRPSSQALDPFAALVSAGSRPSTPSKQSTTLSSMTQPTTIAPSNPTAIDDDWTFTSAPAEPNLTNILNSSLSIDFTAQRLPSDQSLQIVVHYSNSTPQPVSALHFQLAVEKPYALQLKPATSKDIPPKARNAVSQEVLLTGVPVGKGRQIRMRFKVAYSLGGKAMEETGAVNGLGVD